MIPNSKLWNDDTQAMDAQLSLLDESAITTRV